MGRIRWHATASFRCRASGFTLLELIVVVAALSALAFTALSTYQQHIWRTRRLEAYEVLNGIYKAQLAHYTLHGQYADTFDEMGFDVLGARRIDPRTIRGNHYTFTVDAFAVDGAPNANYRATATGDLDPSDPVLDILLIENDLTILP